MPEYIVLIIALAVLLVGGLVGLVTTRVRGRRRTPAPPPPTAPTAPSEPRVGDDAETPRDTPTRTVEDAELPGDTLTAPPVERPESTATRLVRLRL